MNRQKNLLFLGLFVLMLLPLIQQQTRILPVKNLTGAADPAAYPKISTRAWFNGEFQAGFERATEERLGFRAGLIRLKNQLQFSLFRKANAEGVVVGKKNYLYEYDYIRAYAGKDYLGSDFWEEKFRRLALVRDTLRELGVELALVLEPGKASYYPEYIPKAYLRHRGDSTNYQKLVELSGQNQLSFLDLNSFFISQRSKADHPWYTREGVHWAYNGMLAAVDTLLSFSDQLVPETIPDMQVYQGTISRVARDTDDDLARLMNLIKTPARDEKEYPSYRIESANPELRPRVLVISDSYYFNILNARIPEQAFANQAFWYYSKAIYPETWSAPKDTSMIDVRAEVEQMDLILLMITERFYYKLAWNIIETLYQVYYPDEFRDVIYGYCTRIITDYAWFDLVARDAVHKNQALGEVIKDHARYQFWRDDQDGLATKDVSYYIYRIRQDSSWSAQIREKARDNGIPYEHQEYLDAKWMTEQN